MTETIETVKKGERKIVSIIGESGTGKTRLLEEADTLLTNEGFTIHRGDSYSYTSNIAYYPFKQILTRLFNVSEKDSDEEKREEGFRRALDISRQIGDVDMAITLFREVARVSVKNEDFQSVFNNASMLKKLSEQLGYMRERAWALYLLAVSNKAKALAGEINDSYLGSIIDTFYESNQA